MGTGTARPGRADESLAPAGRYLFHRLWLQGGLIRAFVRSHVMMALLLTSLQKCHIGRFMRRNPPGFGRSDLAVSARTVPATGES